MLYKYNIFDYNIILVFKLNYDNTRKQKMGEPQKALAPELLEGHLQLGPTELEESRLVTISSHVTQNLDSPSAVPIPRLGSEGLKLVKRSTPPKEGYALTEFPRVAITRDGREWVDHLNVRIGKALGRVATVLAQMSSGNPPSTLH